MPLSARNHLNGEISDVVLGTVTALITVRLADGVIESVITRRIAEELGLKKGDRVTGHQGDRGHDPEGLNLVAVD